MSLNSQKYLDFIKTRRSIRAFTDSKINKDIINRILDCARWAPSGLNNQPWKVNVVLNQTIKQMLADCTKYSEIIKNAPVNLVVFLNLEKSYNRIKDIQGIGAFMQNILLSTHAMGLGAVWLGEILNQKDKVQEIFKLSKDKYELMGVIALGEINNSEKQNQKERERIPSAEFIDYF